jgi:hypothetical protein
MTAVHDFGPWQIGFDSEDPVYAGCHYQHPEQGRNRREYA